jgi:hypothetical protein
VTLLLLESLGLPSYGAQLNTLRPLFLSFIKTLGARSGSRGL